MATWVVETFEELERAAEDAAEGDTIEVHGVINVPPTGLTLRNMVHIVGAPRVRQKRGRWWPHVASDEFYFGGLICNASDWGPDPT